MKKILFVALFFSIINTKAQRVDVGLGLGAANYWGDLAPSVALNETRGAFNVFARFNITTAWSVTAQYSYLKVGGKDKNFEFNHLRNLNFESTISELSALVEYNFANFGYGVLDSKITGYVFGGLGGFKFTPQTKYAGEVVSLRDVKTEGVTYGTYSVAIPFGVGVKWAFARNLSLEANYNIRKTFTDYLDDVSSSYVDLSNNSIRTQQIADRSYEIDPTIHNKAKYKRGSDNYNDWYMTFTTTLAYRLPGRIKCPTFY